MINITPYSDFLLKIVFSVTARTRFLYRFLPHRLSFQGWGKESCRLFFFDRLHKMLDIQDTQCLILKSNDIDKVLKDADMSLKHQFEVLGSGNVTMQEIYWTKDIKTGYTWNNRFYTKYFQIDDNGNDIKIPWELSRCHHLLWLGEAYLLKAESIYANEIVTQIKHWIKSNPFMYSVNWACSMEVAIRAVNWLYALEMISKSNVLTKEFVDLVSQSLYQHGYFIYHNLEKSHPYSNNHYFSDIVGLLYLGALFADTKSGKKWFSYALKEFYKELRVQILPSGVDCERSISYHRLMTELSICPYYMLKRIGIVIPNDIEYRLRSMLTFINSYTKFSGLAPMVEDNDDGRFLPFLQRDFRQHHYLLDKKSIEVQILTKKIPPLSTLCDTHIMNYSDAGHVIMKKNGSYLFVTNGGMTPYRDGTTPCGTHTHNDRLSFELEIFGNDIIIDPGSYIYTSNKEKHQEFRSTSKHNTIFVDKEEQNFFTGVPFVLRPNSNNDELFILSQDTCQGSYQTIEGKMTHSRKILFEDNLIVIDDSINKKSGNHIVESFYHLAPEVLVDIHDNKIQLEVDDVQVLMFFESQSCYSITVIEDTVSPSYGVLIPSKTVKLESKFEDCFQLKTIIKWRKK